MRRHAAFISRLGPSPWAAVRAIMSMARTRTSSVLPFEARLKKMSEVRRASAVEMDKTTSRESRIERLCAEPTMPDVTIDVERHGWHRPMEKTPRIAELVDRAAGLAAALGFDLHDAPTGGASDANTTSAAGPCGR